MDKLRCKFRRSIVYRYQRNNRDFYRENISGDPRWIEQFWHGCWNWRTWIDEGRSCNIRKLFTAFVFQVIKLTDTLCHESKWQWSDERWGESASHRPASFWQSICMLLRGRIWLEIERSSVQESRTIKSQHEHLKRFLRFKYVKCLRHHHETLTKRPLNAQTIITTERHLGGVDWLVQQWSCPLISSYAILLRVNFSSQPPPSTKPN